MKSFVKNHWYITSFLAFLLFIILSLLFFFIVILLDWQGIFFEFVPFILSLLAVTLLLWRFSPSKIIKKIFFLWLLSGIFLYIVISEGLLFIVILAIPGYIRFAGEDIRCGHLPVVAEASLSGEKYGPYYIPGDEEYPPPYDFFISAYFCTEKDARAANYYHGD